MTPAPPAVYGKTPANSRPERRLVSRRKPIEEAKARVPTINLADRLVADSGGGWRKVGDRWVARCPLPDHEDKTPSFTVYPETNSWFCYGCLRGGDVVELARYAWGYEKSEVGTAAAMVLMDFGREVPPRPPAWFRKQERQRPIRDLIEETRKVVRRERLFRALVLSGPEFEVEDEGERRALVDRAWRVWEDGMQRIGQ